MNDWGAPESDWRRIEALVDVTPDIDTYCSGPDWVFPTHLGFAADQRAIVLGDMERWAALLSSYPDEAGDIVLSGLEPRWGFSCPILTGDPAKHVPELVVELDGIPDWVRLVVTGLTAESELFEALGRNLSRLGTVYMADGMECCVADLSGGVNQWLGRRSSRFRRQWKRWVAAASDPSLTIEDVRNGVGLMDRLLVIERRGWKGQDDDGITAESMERIYRDMIDRLSQRGRLLASIAVLDGEDAGFILGGTRAGVYRGLQLSYAEGAAYLSLGHVLQCHQIRSLEASDVHTYNLGMDMEYKRRWADTVRPTAVLIVHRRLH